MINNHQLFLSERILISVQRTGKQRWNSQWIHAVDNILKLLILFIGFFMTQITFSIYNE